MAPKGGLGQDKKTKSWDYEEKKNLDETKSQPFRKLGLPALKKVMIISRV